MAISVWSSSAEWGPAKGFRLRQEMRGSQKDTVSSGSQVSSDYKERSPTSFVNKTRLLSQ